MADSAKQVAVAALEKWALLARAAEAEPLGMPVHVLTGEAVDTAALFDKHWNPSVDAGGASIPGLSGVAKGDHARITAQTPQEIRELGLAVSEAQTRYLMLVQAAAASPMERAEFIFTELRNTLRFVLDDGKHDDADDRLAALEQAYGDPSSQDGMALALEGYAELCDSLRHRLEQLDDFDVRLIDEARTVAAALRQRSADVITSANPDQVSAAIKLRNQLGMLLKERVRAVRSAASYVFRRQPAVVRSFSSAYERRRRSASRRRAQADAAAKAALDAAMKVAAEAKAKTT